MERTHKFTKVEDGITVGQLLSAMINMGVTLDTVLEYDYDSRHVSGDFVPVLELDTVQGTLNFHLDT